MTRIERSVACFEELTPPSTMGIIVEILKLYVGFLLANISSRVLLPTKLSALTGQKYVEIYLKCVEMWKFASSQFKFQNFVDEI